MKKDFCCYELPDNCYALKSFIIGKTTAVRHKNHNISLYGVYMIEDVLNKCYELLERHKDNQRMIPHAKKWKEHIKAMNALIIKDWHEWLKLNNTRYPNDR